MQQRLNNRWLSEQLIEAVALHASRQDSSNISTREKNTDHGVTSRIKLKTTRQSHRRMWQHLATLLLLVGSAAFSYLAWSQSDASTHSRLQLQSGATTAMPASKPNMLAPQQASVRALRIENHRLQQRVAALRDAIEQVDPED